MAPIAGGGADHPVLSITLTASPREAPLDKGDCQPFFSPPHPHPPVRVRHGIESPRKAGSMFMSNKEPQCTGLKLPKS